MNRSQGHMDFLKKIPKPVICFVSVACLLACATAYDKRGVYHKVRQGESIWKIARYYHIPVQDLAEWNNIQGAEEILPGLKMYIPKLKGAGPLKYKRLPKGERAKFETPIQFDRSRFVWPVGGTVISPFGIRNDRRHDGLDIKAKNGTPIKAAAAGKVVFDGRLRGYGNMLILRHQDRFFTVYAHNSRNAVKKGQKVAKGQVIGYVGSTGRTTGSHLHFEVREGQKARNPLFLLPTAVQKNAAVAKANKPKGKKAGKIGEVGANGEAGKESKEGWSRRKGMMEKLKEKGSK